MNLLKTSSIGLLILGEFSAIYAEMLIARLGSLSGSSGMTLFKIVAFMAFAGCALLTGYYLGYKSFQNIWIIAAVSIVSILIVEPVLAYSFFQELPTRGSTIGLIMGALGLIATLLL